MRGCRSVNQASFVDIRLGQLSAGRRRLKATRARVFNNQKTCGPIITVRGLSL